MTDAGEKLREKSIYLRSQAFAQGRGFAFTSGAVKLAYDFAIDELERAAGIADRLDQVEGGRIAAAIRKLKE